MNILYRIVSLTFLFRGSIEHVKYYYDKKVTDRNIAKNI